MRRLALALCLACSAEPAPSEAADTANTPDAPAVDATADDVPQTPDAPSADDIAHAADAPDASTPEPPPDLARFVDPRIGTDNSGNVAVGAAVPHGWVRLGPDTANEGGDIAAYRWSATRIDGFTHTQLNGAGGSANGYSHILVMPVVGDAPKLASPGPGTPEPWSAGFSHDDEGAEAGFYRVTLDNGVRVELTATGMAGVHRYTFPAGRARAVLDVGHSLGESRGGSLEAVDDRTLEGWGDYQVHPTVALLLMDGEEPGRVATGSLRVYVVARWSRPFTVAHLGRRDGPPCPACTEADGDGLVASLDFGDVAAETVLELQVGLSLVDVATARRNLDGEVAGRSFEAVRDAARLAWNHKLARAQVEATDDDLTVFYTALYHTLLQPADLTERGEDGPAFATAFDRVRHVHPAGDRRYYTDDWCGWDTFRTAHPLRTLLEPEVMGDIIESYVHAWREGGWMDVCPWTAAGYSRVMIGNTAFPMVADALAKGLDDFDAQDAWAGLLQSADNYLDNPLADGLCGYLELGTPESYRTLGWVPDECDPTQAASMTLEYAYQDACLARVAERWGHTADATRLWARSQNWRNQWNPAVGHMQSRKADGTWREPFDPASAATNSGFVESTAWTYTFHVPHDVAGLAQVMGGDAALRARLDAFFDGGHFDMSNEPGFHIPWMYAMAGDPQASSRRVRALLAKHFHTGPGGLPGNDDSGATSAWAAFAQLGLYPVDLGTGRYVLGSPVFDRAVLTPTAGGPPFEIRTVRQAPGAQVYAGATLNGVPLAEPWIEHAQIVAGGVLEITLAP